jgi:hypothetical protein
MAKRSMQIPSHGGSPMENRKLDVQAALYDARGEHICQRRLMKTGAAAKLWIQQF